MHGFRHPLGITGYSMDKGGLLYMGGKAGRARDGCLFQHCLY